MAKYWIYSRNILYLCIYVYLFYNLGVVSSFLGDPKISCEASLKTTSSLSSKFSYFLVRHTCSSMVCISCTWFYLLKQLFWFPVCIHRIVDQLVGGSCRWGPSSRPTAASCHPRRRSCPPLGWHAWLLLLSAWIKVYDPIFEEFSFFIFYVFQIYQTPMHAVFPWSVWWQLFLSFSQLSKHARACLLRRKEEMIIDIPLFHISNISYQYRF